MDKTGEARRSTSTMATSNGVTRRRHRLSENSREQVHQEVRDRPGKKERDPESLNRTKRRRSERFAPKNERDVEEDSSDESLGDDVAHQRKSFPSRHASSLKVADEMIGVPVPRKARSACIKRSNDCRTSSGSGGGRFGEDHRRRPSTSPGSYSLEVVSPSSSTVSVKQKKIVNGSKSRISKPPKSFGTVEDDLEIEIAEVLSGLRKQPQSSKRGDDSEIKGAKTEGVEIACKARICGSANIEKSTIGTKTSSAVSDIDKEKDARTETPSILDSEVSKGVSEGPQLQNNKDVSHSKSKLEIDLMVPPTMPSSPGRVSLLPIVSDFSKRDSSVKRKDKIILKNEMTPEEVKLHKIEKHESLNLDIERPNQETGRDSNRRLQDNDWSQPQQARSAQQSSALPFSVAVGSWPSGLPPQAYVPLTQTSKPVDESNGSSTLVLGASFSSSQHRPKKCATHFFIARNIQLHQHFIKTNHASTPNKCAAYLTSGDLKPAAGNPSLQGNSPFINLNSQAHDGIADNSSVPKEKASESVPFASSRQKKPQPPPPSSSIVPAPAFIFPTNHDLQSVMVASNSQLPTKCPRVVVGSTSVNFSRPSSSASEATQYFTVLPNNAYSFQLSSTIRGGTPRQALPYFNGSFYPPQMFQQPPQLMLRQSPAQRESKASSCSSSSHRPQSLGNVNSHSSQVNIHQHRAQSQKTEAKAAGVNSDSRGSHNQKGGPYGQIMTAPVQPQNLSMSFASFASGATPANLNFSSNGYIISAPFGVHQKNHQESDSKTGGVKCSSNAEDPGKTPAMINGQTLVFDNPSRTLNFVSGTWPPPAATTINGDPSVFILHQAQRQQLSSRSKMMTHSQVDSVSAPSSQWKNPATSSLTSCNLKQFQPQQQIKTHGETQISFAAPLKSQPSKEQRVRSGCTSSLTGSASHGKAANPKVSNSKTLPLSPVPSSPAHAQEQTESSASGSTKKTSPVCGRTMPPIINSCPGHLSELKY